MSAPVAPSPLLPVPEALARILGTASGRPRDIETISIHHAAGRVLAADLIAQRTQPPYAVSAMDGYALRSEDALSNKPLRIIGESAAGHAFSGHVGAGEAVRIFTGAAVPAGADAILIQENADVEGDHLRPLSPVEAGKHIRAAGRDFMAGSTGLTAGQRLNAARLAYAASMNHAEVQVFRRPRVALLATGDELAMPGPDLAEESIIASSAIGLAAQVRAAGAEVIDLGIASDTEASLHAAFDMAEAIKVDLVVTTGGASVGKHDLVRPVLAARGSRLDFYKIAMRPGKPLNFGVTGPMLYLGLPGNPVSTMVCAQLFLLPLMAALQGDAEAGFDRREPAIAGQALPPNDLREEYMRATLSRDTAGRLVAMPVADQDSSLVSLYSAADALLIRPAHAPAEPAGAPCWIIRIS
ncbi:MAG: molybdopterin molybdotransferase MoeA [Rhabdaerophilum sp.]